MAKNIALTPARIESWLNYQFKDINFLMEAVRTFNKHQQHLVEGGNVVGLLNSRIAKKDVEAIVLAQCFAELTEDKQLKHDLFCSVNECWYKAMEEDEIKGGEWTDLMIEFKRITD